MVMSTTEKSKWERRTGNTWGRRFCSFRCHTRDGLVVKLTFGQRIEEGKGGSHADIWRKSFPGGRKSRGKGPGVAVYSQKSIEPGWLGRRG